MCVFDCVAGVCVFVLVGWLAGCLVCCVWCVWCLCVWFLCVCARVCSCSVCVRSCLIVCVGVRV